MNIEPVLVSIPQDVPMRTPQRVRQQRSYARKALRECAIRCGAPEVGWEKDSKDVPLPQAGFYWSVSHKRRWAAAVIADHPVGIDIEHIVPRRDSLFDALATCHEWDILGDRSWHSFFRLWTAKEATLKSSGIGIAGFSTCRLVEVPDAEHMTLEYKGLGWRIEHHYHDDHVAAVTCARDPIHWRVLEYV